MSPTVSVIVPSYNDAAMLEQCLDALARQSRPADELIVVDNGSSDSTVEVARRFGARVVAEAKRGIPQATAAGFDAATGEVLGRLDADSVPPGDWVERVERAFAREPDLDVLSGPGRFYGGSEFIHWFAETLYMPMYYNFVAWLLGHDVVFGSNFAIRREAWRELRPRFHRDRRDVHDDLDLTMNLVPGMGVRFDRSLVVGVSARPFESWPRAWRGAHMAFITAAVNHREESLVERRRAWIASRGAGDVSLGFVRGR